MDGVRKVKAWIELKLARDAKNNKKGFYRYVSQKRKVKESVPPLMSKADRLVTTDEKKDKVLKKFLPQSLLTISIPKSLEWMDC